MIHDWQNSRSHPDRVVFGEAVGVGGAGAFSEGGTTTGASGTGPLLAKALGAVSADLVWKILRRNRMSLSRSHSWCVSRDPEFVRKAAEIVGLYLWICRTTRLSWPWRRSPISRRWSAPKVG